MEVEGSQVVAFIQPGREEKSAILTVELEMGRCVYILLVRGEISVIFPLLILAAGAQREHLKVLSGHAGVNLNALHCLHSELIYFSTVKTFELTPQQSVSVAASV